MTVLTIWVTRGTVDATFTSTRDVSITLRTPSGLFGHPTDLRLTHEAADPVTTVFLLDDHFAFRTVHGFTILQHHLEYLCGSFGCSIVLCPEAKVILVVFTVHVFVNGLAEEAIGFIADVAGKLVDIVFKYAPAGAVRGFTVVTVLTA